MSDSDVIGPSGSSDEILKLQNELESLRKKYDRESNSRRDLLNQVQELKGNIRVIARVRPLKADEEIPSCLEILDESTIFAPLAGINPSNSSSSLSSSQTISTNTSMSKKYQFDRVLGPSASQSDVFDEVSTLADSILDGFNCCLFAYGQTGSGKTHTMEGPPSDPGVNIRMLNKIFDQAQHRQNVSYDMHVSIYEIYNEIIIDLLDQTQTSPYNSNASSANSGLKLRQGEHGIVVADATKFKVSKIDEMNNAIEIAKRVRSVASTDMNEHSSRSHCVICLDVRGRRLTDDTVSYSKLFLIDLAGSERVGQSGVQGKALDEAKHINKSLSALARVMECLQLKRQHVPFRDSTLTHLLRDSLSGDSKTCLLVNLSPAASSYNQSINSMNFGIRVRKIERGPLKKNIDVDREKFNAAKAEQEMLISELKSQISNLQSQLSQKDAQIDALTVSLQKSNSDAKMELDNIKMQYEKQIAALNHQIETMNQKLTATSQENTQLSQSITLIKKNHQNEMATLKNQQNHVVISRSVSSNLEASQTLNGKQFVDIGLNLPHSSKMPTLVAASIMDKENSDINETPASKKYSHISTPIKTSPSSFDSKPIVPLAPVVLNSGVHCFTPLTAKTVKRSVSDISYTDTTFSMSSAKKPYSAVASYLLSAATSNTSENTIDCDLPQLDDKGVLQPVIITPKVMNKTELRTASPIAFELTRTGIYSDTKSNLSLLDGDISTLEQVSSHARIEASIPASVELPPIAPNPISEHVAEVVYPTQSNNTPAASKDLTTSSNPLSLSSSTTILKACLFDRSIPDRPKKTVSFSENDSIFVYQTEQVLAARRPPVPVVSRTVGTARAAPSPASPIKSSVPARSSAPTSTTSSVSGPRRVVAKPAAPSSSSVSKNTPARVRPIGKTSTLVPATSYKTY